MIVKLPFGKNTCPVDLRGIRVRPIECSAPLAVADPAPLVAQALDHPLDGPPLTDICAGGGPATVIVPDSTRETFLPAVLPEVLRRFRLGGIAESETTILVACGTHPPADERSLRALVGDIPGPVRVVQHDARATSGLVEAGTVDRLPIRFNRIALESKLLVTVSGVRHHYFAGFGGGPKMVFPGVAGYSEIQANHAKVLQVSRGEPTRHPHCEPGVRAGNPVAEEIARAADLCPPALALCLVPGRRGGVAQAVAGPWRPAFEAAVRSVRSWFETTPPRPTGLAVASAGGAPSDASLIQAHKSLDAMCRFLEEGGELLFVADLSDGLGSRDMEPFVDEPRREAILRRLEAEWVQYGHTTLRLLEKTSRFRIHLVSNLDPELARRLGFHPVTDPAKVVETWRRTHPGATAVVMGGPAVYPSRS